MLCKMALEFQQQYQRRYKTNKQMHTRAEPTCPRLEAACSGKQRCMRCHV